MTTPADAIQDFTNREYKWGFVTTIEEDRIPKGLNEDVIRLISEKKKEPAFMLEWRLKAYRHWAKLEKSDAEPKSEWPGQSVGEPKPGCRPIASRQSAADSKPLAYGPINNER